MTNIEKIAQLRAEIKRQLEPLLGGQECIYLDAPYHDNVGDLCIWQGARNFLESVCAKTLFTQPCYWTPGRKLSKETVIVLNGGGNFGDIYRGFQNFRLKVIDAYPDNRIVMLPQSVWYDDPSLIAADAEKFSRHGDLWLCARDNAAYDFMKKYFGPNHVLLVPDMAFYIDDSIIEPLRGGHPTGRRLFMRRIDGELTADTPASLGEGREIHDWPTYEGQMRLTFFILTQLERSLRWSLKLKLIPLARIMESLNNAFAANCLRPRVVNTGLRFLSGYDHVSTTRLHALILSVLLDLPVEQLDNRTGKLTDFVNTWLSDIPTIQTAK